jgi:hypothetical protein
MNIEVKFKEVAIMDKNFERALEIMTIIINKVSIGEELTYSEELFQYWSGKGEYMIGLSTYNENLDKVKPSVGRPKTIELHDIQTLKNEGKTQEQCSHELGVSLSTIRRNWK